MRLKIIAGNVVAVLVVGLVSFFVVRSQIESAVTKEIDARIDSDNALFAITWRLSGIEFLDHVRDRARNRSVRGVFAALDESSRRRRAFEAADQVAAWFQDPARGRGSLPDIVVITDETGKVVARNQDINRLYGQSLVKQVPALSAALKEGRPQHDVWMHADENKLLQIAVAPIHSQRGGVVGVLLVGYDLSNGMARAESKVLGRDVAILTEEKVYSSSLSAPLAAKMQKQLYGESESSTRSALGGGSSGRWSAAFGGQEYVGVTSSLPMTPSAKVAYVVLANKTRKMELADVSMVILLLMAVGVLGVVLYGFMIGTGLLRPLEEIEEGVLAVINGRTDLRLDVESAEFGGLAYRINQLINVFTGVSETDEDGVSSGGEWAGMPGGAGGEAPAAAASSAGGSDVIEDANLAAQLASEPEDAYQTRVYQEYVSAKQSVGEDVSGISQDRFIKRLERNAQGLAQKHGCRMVRFQVQAQGKQVVLRPVLIR